MHVGAATIFQNPGKFASDYQVYRAELRLADLAEPLGFQSIWGVEHHFTDYTMCPDVLQFLTYMAGRTTNLQLGSMVCVLPWHDPMRVAEQVAMLDNISDGRFILGVGRGLAKVEYDGFRVDMNESRTRFIESAECLLAGLESGFCEFDGEYIQQPRREIRPNPFRTFRGRAYAAAISPESSRIMAQLGVGIWNCAGAATGSDSTPERATLWATLVGQARRRFAVPVPWRGALRQQRFITMASVTYTVFPTVPLK